MRRTTGEDRNRPPGTTNVVSSGASRGYIDSASRAGGAADPSGPVCTAGSGTATGASSTVSPGAPISATTLSTGTVSPSRAVILSSTPAAGDGISASTLSVEISNSGSSRSTVSPTFLFHRTIVPSAIDSPICGMTTSVAITNLGSSLRRPGGPPTVQM